MRATKYEHPSVYVKGTLPEHLHTWAADVGIEFRPHHELALYCLRYTKDRLELHWNGQQNFLPTSAGLPGRKRVSCRNLLIKALGKKSGVVADLTAGLGVDALTIASTGRKVYCIERCPPVAMLLFDGVSRCRPALADLLEVYFDDSKSWLESNSAGLDAIYIDTMFRDKKKSVKPSRQMQVLRMLAGDDPDAQELLKIALTQKVSRVIEKSSARTVPPAFNKIASYTGKSVRFNVFRPNWAA